LNSSYHFLLFECCTLPFLHFIIQTHTKRAIHSKPNRNHKAILRCLYKSYQKLISSSAGTQHMSRPSRLNHWPLLARISPNMASSSSALNWTTSSSQYEETPLKGPTSRPDVTELRNTWFHISITGWLLGSTVNVVEERPSHWGQGHLELVITSWLHGEFMCTFQWL
jgi:hypothetical protein